MGDMLELGQSLQELLTMGGPGGGGQTAGCSATCYRDMVCPAHALWLALVA